MNMHMPSSMRRSMITASRPSGLSKLRAFEPIPEETLRTYIPSLFADDKHSSRSAKFTYIPTIDIVHGLQAEGWQVFAAAQGGSKDEEKRGFTKHLVRLRREGQVMQAVGDTLHELVLRNAHDGTASYELLSGWFRLACLNGMVVSDRNHPEYAVKYPHRGDIIDKVIEGSYRVIGEAENQKAQIEQMHSVPLRAEEQHIFANAAIAARFEEESPAFKALRPEQLLAARRREDVGNDIWSTFQRVQENLTKGGQEYVTHDERNQPRYNRTRALSGVEADTKLNKALWMLSTEMLRMKQSA